MKIYYAKSTGYFYDSRVHSSIPADAVEVSEAERLALLSSGKEIVGNDLGSPVLVEPPKPTLADLKIIKNAEINAARLVANRGTFTHAGKVFACDELSRSDIDGANGIIANLGAMPVGWPGSWKAVDNTYLPITTVAEWQAFYGSMFAAGAANFAHAQALKEALAAATTPAEVAAVVW